MANGLMMRCSILQGRSLIHVTRGMCAAKASDVAKDLDGWLEDHTMSHTVGASYHLMTQGNIARRHLSLNSRIMLDNYCLANYIKCAIASFVGHCNHQRYRENLDNLAPADVYFGRGQNIRDKRNEIKRQTIEQRRRNHFKRAA